MMLLVIGGSGSGKSKWAERVIASLPAAQKRFYIATMQVWDEESRRRVARHREQRAQLGFETVECPTDLAALRLPSGCAALLEDLPNLLANEMFGGGDPERILPALQALSARCGTLILVTGNVFADGVAYDPSTQTYIRRLAALNSAAARLADTVVEVVYSLPLALKGALPCV